MSVYILALFYLNRIGICRHWGRRRQVSPRINRKAALQRHRGFIAVTGHLDIRVEAEDAHWVGRAEHLQFQLWFEAPYLFTDRPAIVVIVMLRAVEQRVTGVIQGRKDVCFDR